MLNNNVPLFKFDIKMIERLSTLLSYKFNLSFDDVRSLILNFVVANELSTFVLSHIGEFMEVADEKVKS